MDVNVKNIDSLYSYSKALSDAGNSLEMAASNLVAVTYTKESDVFAYLNRIESALDRARIMCNEAEDRHDSYVRDTPEEFFSPYEEQMLAAEVDEAQELCYEIEADYDYARILVQDAINRLHSLRELAAHFAKTSASLAEAASHNVAIAANELSDYKNIK